MTRDADPVFVAERLTRDLTSTCEKLYPTASFPREVAGESVAADVVKCRLREPRRSDYTVAFSDEQWERLTTVFDGGVCDYSVPGVEQQPLAGTWLRFRPVRRHGGDRGIGGAWIAVKWAPEPLDRGVVGALAHVRSLLWGPPPARLGLRGLLPLAGAGCQVGRGLLPFAVASGRWPGRGAKWAGAGRGVGRPPAAHSLSRDRAPQVRRSGASRRGDGLDPHDRGQERAAIRRTGKDRAQPGDPHRPPCGRGGPVVFDSQSRLR